MTLTWIAIVASLAMGLAGACVFIWAVKKDYFRNIEDAKYQVFWSDLQDTVDRVEQEPHERRTHTQ
jgi:cbb3-type cytochrome oxidase maturation protein